MRSFYVGFFLTMAVSIGRAAATAIGSNNTNGDLVIPALSTTVGVPGISAMPEITDMGAGEGPAFMEDIVRLLSIALNTPLQYVQQNALGTVTLSGFKGGNLAFTPSNFQNAGDTRADGVYAMGDGRYHVERKGQTLAISPAFVHLEQLTALFAGISARLEGNGVLSAQINGVTYAVQPGVAVQLDRASGGAQLTMGGDGFWHCIDALRSDVLSLDPRASLSIQLDGTAAIVFKGQRFVVARPLAGRHSGRSAWPGVVARHCPSLLDRQYRTRRHSARLIGLGSCLAVDVGHNPACTGLPAKPARIYSKLHACSRRPKTILSYQAPVHVDDGMLDMTATAMIPELREVLKRLHYPLSFRHLEELMQERGVFVDHSTVHRWALKMLPIMAVVFRRQRRPVGTKLIAGIETMHMVKERQKHCPNVQAMSAAEWCDSLAFF